MTRRRKKGISDDTLCKEVKVLTERLVEVLAELDRRHPAHVGRLVDPSIRKLFLLIRWFRGPAPRKGEPPPWYKGGPVAWG